MPKAVVCRTLGQPETLRIEESASLPLQPGQLRVRIRAAGINFPDILMAAGEYQLKPELPFTPGMEAAGDISEIADGLTGFKIGDRVIVKLRFGGYAEEVVVAPSQLTHLPATFDCAEGATFLAAHGTAGAYPTERAAGHEAALEAALADGSAAAPAVRNLAPYLASIHG